MRFWEKFGEVMVLIMTICTIPIMLLNVFGGIISGIWLAILGEWNIILLSIVLFFASTFTISIALMPSMLLIAPAAVLLQRGNKLWLFFGALNLLYTFVVIIIWCMWILNTYVNAANDRSLLPILIWSYGTALGPWLYFASKERDNSSTMFTTFIVALSYIVAMIMMWFGVSIQNVIVTFTAIVLVSGIFQLLALFPAMMRK
ncbi:MAG: hypothetical protein PHZ00_03785 [Candidatus Peribacteraceae bacterium]|nr:hypothetical protein [Candidatus Peribacteraceae bacterium]